MDYGNRPDGTAKGQGFFGELKRADGGVSTEISIGVGINGKEVDIPLIVPGLNKKELNYLLSTPVESKGFMSNMPQSIIEKAYEHARVRIGNGDSPFAGPDEIQEPPK